MLIMLAVTAGAGAQNQASSFVLERNDRTIVLEPYADNIVRITLSTAKSAALGAPGYGIVGTPSITGWTQERDPDGYDVIRSGRSCPHFMLEGLGLFLRFSQRQATRCDTE
jgi:hypothetical protein